ncbi:MAG: class I SAM-dependent methyltransferase [Rubripirellula sp.]
MNTENEPAPGSEGVQGPVSSPDDSPPPQWRRPRGVAPGTWDYLHERSIADHYDAFVADTPLCRVDIERLQSLFPPLQNPRSELVLDLGCGSGRAALPLAERGYDVLGIDLSRSMLQVMVAKARSSEAAGRVFPLQANLVELACLATESADHAICLFSTLGMIQGRENRREMLQSVARIVRPDGQFLLHVHHRWAAIREYRGTRQLLGSWWNSLRNPASEFGDSIYAYRGLERMFMHRFTQGELRRDLETTGWRVVQVSPLSIDGTKIDRRAWIPGGFLVDCRRG